MKLNAAITRSIVVMAPVGIVLLCTGARNAGYSSSVVTQCYCYTTNDIDCSCATDDPIQSNYGLCEAGVFHKKSLCSWPQANAITPKRPWAKAVAASTPYTNYTVVPPQFSCKYPCPHPKTYSGHYGSCPQNYAWIKGYYFCDQDKATLQAGPCSVGGEGCP